MRKFLFPRIHGPDYDLCIRSICVAQLSSFSTSTIHSETWRISLFREHFGRTDDMDTKEYATFRYDTIEVENGL